MRPIWLARFTSSANVSSSVPPSVDRDAGGEGDRRIPGVRLEHHPQRAAGAHRQMLVDCDGDRRTAGDIVESAIVIADHEHSARIEIEAA